METILLQINNDKAYKLIEDMEALQLVKVLSKGSHPREKLSEKFGGFLHLSDEEYTRLQEAFEQSREEWERPI